VNAFDKLIADLQEFLVAALPRTDVLVGARHLGANAAPPRVVVVPTTDQIGAPLKVGTNPRQLFSADTGIAVHLWGKTYGDAVDMRDATVRAARARAFASLQVRGAGWLNPLQDAWIKAGEVYVLELSLPIPITEATAKLVGRATSVEPITTGATGDGWTEPGDA
jgi:hypothetical protein